MQLLIILLILFPCYIFSSFHELDPLFSDCGQFDYKNFWSHLVRRSWPEDDLWKNSLFCFGKQIGILNADGTVNYEANKMFWMRLYDEKIIDIPRKCTERRGNSKDTLNFLFKCVAYSLD
ncbi:unnamed protein product [Brassicogethes aeneus]|uniref:Uncharacterized protein n=1 Tax=Brassicogethes aeneus TaxID=1431903 RepID=A0A9P0AZH0_BRAAE|nr:unnamed protein product [Brassicogethes aeneus]